MDYCFTIDKFSGPLDLLLHLIKESNIDIYDIKIEQITGQYLDYIKKMEEMNLNIASSYLVMAAELIEMKASLLLPKPEVVTDEYEEDPKDRLIKRLLEYKNYKDMISTFQELEVSRQQYYTKSPCDISEFNTGGTLNDDVCLDDLIAAFQKFLVRKEISKPLNTKIMNKEYSISQRSREIKDIIKKRKNVKFTELFDVYTKSYLVVNFLSILVLTKNKEVVLKQDNNFGEIMISEVN